MPTIEPGTGRVIPDRVLPSRQEFMDRFPVAVLDMIFEHQVRDTPLGAQIRKALMRYQVVSEIDPTDDRTKGPVHAMIDAAIGLGVLPAEERESAIAQILAPP